MWRDCSTGLARLWLEKKLRRSSSMRSQELADLDDIIESFDALDTCLPEVFCSADDLLQMPQLLPLRCAKQMAKDVCALHVDVCSCLEGIDKRLQLPFPAPSVSENGSNTNCIVIAILFTVYLDGLLDSLRTVGMNLALLFRSFRSMATIVHSAGIAPCCFHIGTSRVKTAWSVGAASATSSHNCFHDRVRRSLTVPLVKRERASCEPRKAKSSRSTCSVRLMMLARAAVLRREDPLPLGLLQSDTMAFFRASCGVYVTTRVGYFICTCKY